MGNKNGLADIHGCLSIVLRGFGKGLELPLSVPMRGYGNKVLLTGPTLEHNQYPFIAPVLTLRLCWMSPVSTSCKGNQAANMYLIGK